LKTARSTATMRKSCSMSDEETKTGSSREDTQSGATAGKARWFRISLRTLLVAFTCVAIAIGCFAQYAQQRKAAFAAIRKAGGTVLVYPTDPPSWMRWFGMELVGSANQVDLRKGNVDNDLMTHIGRLTELRRLDLSDANIDDEGLRRIAHLPVYELWLQGTHISDRSAETLSKMKTLEFLQLNATTVSDGFLEHLESLPKLENLGLRGAKVTSEGMKYLSRHPRLKKVDVYSTAVGDTGVKYLAQCQLLTDVGLSMTTITDQAFVSLGMLPKLEHVDVTANRPTTAEASKNFANSHPGCNVER
jgi:hypothetical protein